MINGSQIYLDQLQTNSLMLSYITLKHINHMAKINMHIIHSMQTQKSKQ
jgi:hypothetical protein